MPPKIAKPKEIVKKPRPKPKHHIDTVDLTGGKLRRITRKQLERAKKKPVPRRPKKKRKRNQLALMV